MVYGAARYSKGSLMSASIRHVSLSVLSFAMLGFALLACGDEEEETEPTTTIDQTSPTSDYRSGQDQAYRSLLERVPAAEEEAAVRKATGDMRQVPPRQLAVPPVKSDEPRR